MKVLYVGREATCECQSSKKVTKIISTRLCVISRRTFEGVGSLLGGDIESDYVMEESGKNALSSFHQLLRSRLVCGEL
jgi:hypothetical protein